MKTSVSIDKQDAEYNLSWDYVIKHSGVYIKKPSLPSYPDDRYIVTIGGDNGQCTTFIVNKDGSLVIPSGDWTRVVFKKSSDILKLTLNG